MCKYCEMPDTLDRHSSNVYGEPNEAFVIYKTPDNKFILGCEFVDGDFVDIGTGDYYWENVIIEYCPFCGRKLGGE